MQQSCKQCGITFSVTDDDLKFYEKVSPVFSGVAYPITPPTHCPDCRLQRRIAWRNERYMSKAKCGKCQKDMVTIMPEGAPFPVYCNKCWWGDGWDGRNYGRDFDFSRPFFKQLRELVDKVPQLTIQNDDGIGSQNCAYCQDFAYGKNCYMTVGTWYTEDSFYSNANCSYNKNISDCINVLKSELVYESTDCQSLYSCAFLQSSENCSDCFFGIDLKGCKNCFGCIGLRQKEFYIFNQPHTEEEYRAKVESFKLSSYEQSENLKKQFQGWSLHFPRKNMNLRNSENSIGNELYNCKDTYGFSMSGSEGSKYCQQCDLSKFCYDVINSGCPQWCLDSVTPDDSYLTHFSWFSWKNKNVLYGINCHSSENLMGCVGLHRAKYCILNKQYTKEGYEELVPKIIEHMTDSRSESFSNVEWGEFPPVKYSFFPYNETVAQEYFPMTKEEVLAKGWKWKDKDPREYLKQTYEVADDIGGVGDEVCDQILTCLECGKNYKIIPLELKFYKKMSLPIPRRCPDCRHIERLKKRPLYKLWERACAKCAAAMKTPYSPERPEIVYCEKCYLEGVY